MKYCKPEPDANVQRLVRASILAQAQRLVEEAAYTGVVLTIHLQPTPGEPLATRHYQPVIEVRDAR